MFESQIALLIAGAMIGSTLLTGWLRQFALARRLVDVPNARSSHVLPTPRGGGVAIVMTVLGALPLLAAAGVIAPTSLWALLGAGVMVGAIGWLDDNGGVPARYRLVVHLIASAWALAWLGGLPPLPIFSTTIDLGWFGELLAVLYLTWLLNLYNFMDGIDGIASVEAVTVCIGGALIYGLATAAGDAWVTPILLLSAVTGFLVWNFPRARIFMGDAGSGFIGMMLGLLSLQAAAAAPQLFWGWVILLGAFIVDATVTLICRVVRGERVYQAHCTHAYQREARRRGSHVPVTLAFGTINVVWLLPIASVVALGWLDGALGVLLAYAPLVWLALRSGAGRPE